MIDDTKVCYFCHSQRNLTVHHCLQGPNRKNAEKYGLKVYLCFDCHYSVHNIDDSKVMELRRVAQSKFEETHTREEFMQVFHKNYL